ncbi:hypothetical protein E3V55_03620 [Candidatus Marinimicrobia bacterium MT.SAG.3]|nr:hypothetical protein E3V55_03620 [Candidatus Marinimicrobia bacterium MT.SAG.3]
MPKSDKQNTDWNKVFWRKFTEEIKLADGEKKKVNIKQMKIGDFLQLNSISLKTKLKNLNLDKTNPKEFSMKIGDTGEKAFQRGLIRGNKTINLNVQRLKKPISIEVWDLEVPVAPGGAGRRPSTDLICGNKVDKSDVFLVELKFAKGKNRGDSPIWALIEGLNYCLMVDFHRKFLQKYNVKHNHDLVKKGNYWNNLAHKKSIPNLVVAANRQYWINWMRIDEDGMLEFFEIVSNVRKSIFPSKIFISIFNDQNFEAQKNSKKTYEPSIEEHHRDWNCVETREDLQNILGLEIKNP